MKVTFCLWLVKKQGVEPSASTDLPCGSFLWYMRPSPITLTLFLLGGAAVLAGLTFKLNHLLGAEPLFNAGAFAFVAGLLSAIKDVWSRRGE